MSYRKLKICLINPDFYSSEMPARPAITEIYGKYLPSFGHKVTWTSLSNENTKEIKKTKFNQVTIYLIPYRIHRFLFGKIVNFVRFYFREYKLLNEMYDNGGYDIIQVRNDVFAALMALHFKKKFNIPFVFQYSFPNYAFRSQKLEKIYSYYLGQIRIYVQKYVLKKADLVFPISKWMKEELIREGISEYKMVPLPMGVNPELFCFKKNDLNIQVKYHLNGSQILLYIGSMDKLRSLDTIILAFSRIQKSNSNTKLLMVGDGNDRVHLEELSAELGINESVIFTKQISYFDIPNFISAADVCLSPINPIDIYKVSSPTKLFECMVMQKPVVANEEIPEQKEVIEESGGGVLVKFEAESFADGIIGLLDNFDKAKEMGIKGHEWVVKNRSYENMAREVEKKYFELLKYKEK